MSGQENALKAILFGFAIFVKESVNAISHSVGSIFESLKDGVSMIVQIGYQDSQMASLVVDRDLFEDDIE